MLNEDIMLACSKYSRTEVQLLQLSWCLSVQMYHCWKWKTMGLMFNDFYYIIRPSVLPVSFPMNGSFQHLLLGVFVCVVYKHDSCRAQMCNSTEYGAIHSHDTHTHTGVVVCRYQTTSCMFFFQWSSNHLDSPFTLSQQRLASIPKQKSAEKLKGYLSDFNVVFFANGGVGHKRK